MSIRWPKEIHDVLVKYHIIMLKNKKLENSDKNNMVAELIEAYRRLNEEDQAVFLVPANGAFVEDQSLEVDFSSIAAKKTGKNRYEKAAFGIIYLTAFMKSDGFVPGTEISTELSYNKEYDRIGSPYGRFLCPIKDDGTPETYLARAIPYYIPDEADVTSSPAYHRYVAMKDYKENDTYPKEGIIKQVFRKGPDDGGGKQVVFSKAIKNIYYDKDTGKGVIKDVKI